jgi:hypothetical protein
MIFTRQSLDRILLDNTLTSVELHLRHDFLAIVFWRVLGSFGLAPVRNTPPSTEALEPAIRELETAI